MIDIYSFGVILLELISGREVIHGGMTPNKVTWVSAFYGYVFFPMFDTIISWLFAFDINK